MHPFNIIVTHTIDREIPGKSSEPIGSVTRGMLRQRAVELAVINGRPPHQASKSDWESAKRELTGRTDPNDDPSGQASPAVG